MAITGTNFLTQSVPLNAADAVVAGDYIVAISQRAGATPAPNPPMPMDGMVILHRPTMTARIYNSPTGYSRFPGCMALNDNGIVYIGSSDSGFVGSPRMYGVDPVSGAVATYPNNGVAVKAVACVDEFVIHVSNSQAQWTNVNTTVLGSTPESFLMPSESWSAHGVFNGRFLIANSFRVREWYPDDTFSSPAPSPAWTLVNEWVKPPAAAWSFPSGKGVQIGDTINWAGGSAVLRFRPSTGEFWTVPATPAPSHAIVGGSKVCTLNGLIYGLSASVGGGQLNCIAVIDPETGRWAREPNTISTPPTSPSTTWRLTEPVAADGKLYIANGEPFVWP